MQKVLRVLYKRRNILLYMIFVVALLLSFSFGFSHSYYEEVQADDALKNIDIEAKTLDDIRFNVTSNLELPLITQDNFGPSATNNISGSTTATATLKANNARTSDTYEYYFYMVASSPFVYTDTTNNQAEVLLQITYNNVEITPSNKATYGLDLHELTYKTSNTGLSSQVSGWDITQANFVTIASGKEISASANQTVTDSFGLTIVFAKLDGVDQYENSGKQYRARLIMRQDEPIDPATITYSNSPYTACTNVNCALVELYDAIN